ncbi:FxsA family protein [Niallia sp. Krafla_26]|uniref:FxsA family protein n=1 Tax=Niallia sp. Krafla_26 TaxID=3064703 RepID=UPI003D16D9BF
MRIAILLFILIPALEITVLLLSGKTIGIWPTFLLIVLTGVFGAYLAKKQGLNTMRNLQRQFQNGIFPNEEIVNGVCILIGGIMLLSPGFITDLIGLILLIPFTRTIVKPFLMKMLQKWVNRRSITIIR